MLPIIIVIVAALAAIVYLSHESSKAIHELAQVVIRESATNVGQVAAAYSEAIRAVEHVATSAVAPAPAVEQPEVENLPTMPPFEVPWDHTDDDPFLADPMYAQFVPKQQLNDAPPVTTHPLGIPGLHLPEDFHAQR